MSITLNRVNLEPILFEDIGFAKVQVQIGGVDYWLEEASGEAAVKYRNAVMGCTQLGNDGKPSRIIGLGETEPMLVSLCLYKLVKIGNEEKKQYVSVQTIKGWPAKIQKGLFKRIMDISDLREEEETEEALERTIKESQEKLDRLKEGHTSAKNGQSATMVGSE